MSFRLALAAALTLLLAVSANAATTLPTAKVGFVYPTTSVAFNGHLAVIKAASESNAYFAEGGRVFISKSSTGSGGSFVIRRTFMAGGVKKLRNLVNATASSATLTIGTTGGSVTWSLQAPRISKITTSEVTAGTYLTQVTMRFGSISRS